MGRSPFTYATTAPLLSRNPLTQGWIELAQSLGVADLSRKLVILFLTASIRFLTASILFLTASIRFLILRRFYF
ncbi:MAG: hypothetical protein HC833_06440 [Leptolyngbyaceae cyanobacterium RM1_406_9]|nr:hypothetical protein [Leptolyngbyaceae cyanobacterium RM1_406_9]